MNKLAPALSFAFAASLTALPIVPAWADGFGETVLQLSNLRILHSDGTPYLLSSLIEPDFYNQVTRSGISAELQGADAGVFKCSGDACPLSDPDVFDHKRPDGYEFHDQRYFYMVGGSHTDGQLFPSLPAACR
jgi:hypothetical protein